MSKLILHVVCLLALSSPCVAQSRGGEQAGLFPVAVRGRAGHVDGRGRMVIKPRFDDGWGFSEGLAPVRVGGRWGYIDRRGRIVVRPRFSETGDFRRGVAKVNTGGRFGTVELGYRAEWAYIDRRGVC